MLQLPPIVDSARSLPLSYNPHTGSFIYYDAVQEGSARLYPLDKLGEAELQRLAIERQLRAGSDTGVLNGNRYTSGQIADEMRKGTKLGQQLMQAELDYLRYYLSHFPPESFEE